MRVSIVRAFCAFLLLASTQPDLATRYHVDPGSSAITAKVAYFGLSSKTVQFPKMAGTVDLDPAQPDAVTIKVVIDAGALTASDKFIVDNLKSENFFWVERYPEVTFSGRGLTLDSATGGTVSGTITARGISRPATLAVTLAQPISQKTPPRTIDLVGRTTIDRREFGMTSFPFVVGNLVEVKIDAHLVTDSAPAA